MADTIRSVRVFAGTVDSSNKALSVPATLTLVEREGEFECRFVFFVGEALPLSVRAPKSAGTTLRGTARDPRGWDVSFAAELKGERVNGTYDQPHDRGTFALREV